MAIRQATAKIPLRIPISDLMSQRPAMLGRKMDPNLLAGRDVEARRSDGANGLAAGDSYQIVAMRTEINLAHHLAGSRIGGAGRRSGLQPDVVMADRDEGFAAG